MKGENKCRVVEVKTLLFEDGGVEQGEGSVGGFELDWPTKKLCDGLCEGTWELVVWVLKSKKAK